MSETMIKKQLEGSEIQSGACRYCGQIHQFETDGRVSDDKLDQWATEKCRCGEFKKEIKRLERESQARESIRELIGDTYPETAGLLGTGLKLILADKIAKMSVDTGNGAKASITVNAKGGIKVEFVATAKKSKEV